MLHKNIIEIIKNIILILLAKHNILIFMFNCTLPESIQFVHRYVLLHYPWQELERLRNQTFLL